MNTILPEPNLILDPPEVPEIPLPKGWTDYTLLAILHVIALARIVLLNAANCYDCTQRIFVPISKNEMINETRLFFEWYDEHRPHMTLECKTPNEVYFNRHAANAKPRMCIAGKAGTKVKVRLEFLEGKITSPNHSR
jgi:hypothetical protein